MISNSIRRFFLCAPYTTLIDQSRHLFTRCVRSFANSGKDVGFDNISVPPPVALLFDTETTGKVDFRKKIDDPSQPELVQLGLIVVDMVTWKPRMTMSLLNRDISTPMSIEAEKVHGISMADCTRYGVPLPTILHFFQDACENVDCIVAHNMKFDRTVIQASYHRAAKQHQLLHDPFQSPKNGTCVPQICTMEGSTEILKLPSSYRNGKYKWPSLEEAHRYFSAESEGEIDNAHDALADATACLTIFRGLVESGALDPIPKRQQTARETPQLVRSDIEKNKDENSSTGQPASIELSDTNSVVARSGELTLKVQGNGFEITGNTYPYKDYIKSLGATWNPISRVWAFNCTRNLEPACKLVGIPMP